MELDIPKLDYNSRISGRLHTQMTGRVIIVIEQVLLKEQPNRYGSSFITFVSRYRDNGYKSFGDGYTAVKIVELLEKIE